MAPLIGILSHYFSDFYNRLPVWRGRCLDENYIRASQDNTIGSYFLCNLRPSNNDDSPNLEIDKIKGMKQTRLDNQNFSLLNQLTYEFDKRKGRIIYSRPLLNKIRLNLLGEGASDAGGPRREYFELVCDEAIQKLKLFISSPNNTGNVGEERDKLVPNPMANSPCDIDNFYKIGIYLAIALKSQDCTSLMLPSVLWEYLLGKPLTTNSLISVAHNLAKCIDEISKLSADELEDLGERHTAYLLSGKEIELYPGSSNIPLTADNRIEYVVANLKVQLGQLEKAFSAIRSGFRSILPVSTIESVTPEQLEKYICGMNYVSLSFDPRLTLKS